MNTSTTMSDVISSDKVEGANVYNLAGGTKAWTAAGFGLVKPARQAVG